MSSVPLTQAVTSGDADAVKAVLANGADVNERTGGGQTPLILATIFGHTHLIPLLLDAGADPQLRDNLGLNAIDWAQRRGATEALDVLRNEPRQTSITRTTAHSQTLRTSSTASINSDAEKSSGISDEERSRRWIAGLKQRIAEQSHPEAPDGPNIFRPQSAPPPVDSQREPPRGSQPWLASAEREPQPEIPVEPSAPQPELPATAPQPEPEIPAPSPDPQRELPAQPRPPEPESPAEPPYADGEIEAAAKHAIPKQTVVQQTVAKQALTYQAERQQTVASQTGTPQTGASQTVAEDPVPRSGRKRCPKCNAIYNSDLIAYCAHHIVPLVDADEPAPIISQPQTTSPVLFWLIIIATLAGSLVVGSYVAKFLYSSEPLQPAVTASPPTPSAVQKGTPVVSKELEGKVLSLPIAECPLNGQEAIPGTVVVRVTVNRSGQVIEAKASGGDWLLRGAANEAAMKSTFAREKLRSRATAGTITYTFEP